jgi:hypothetical protein
MDSRELRSIQEAYMEVVENQQLDEGYVEFTKDRGPRKPSPRGKLVTKASQKRLGNILAPHHRDAKKQGERIEKMTSVRDTHSPEKSQAKAAANKARGENRKRAFGNRLTRSDRQGIRDSYDIYDIILSHLLDEGYADTNEAALAIMANMSEEWREEIMEGLKSIDTPEKAQGYAIRALGSATKAAFTRDKKTYEKRLKGLKMGQRKAERKAAEEN